MLPMVEVPLHSVVQENIWVLTNCSLARRSIKKTRFLAAIPRIGLPVQALPVYTHKQMWYLDTLVPKHATHAQCMPTSYWGH
jgi:hypothetical protein